MGKYKNLNLIYIYIYKFTQDIYKTQIERLEYSLNLKGSCTCKSFQGIFFFQVVKKELFLFVSLKICDECIRLLLKERSRPLFVFIYFIIIFLATYQSWTDSCLYIYTTTRGSRYSSDYTRVYTTTNPIHCCVRSVDSRARRI